MKMLAVILAILVVLSSLVHTHPVMGTWTTSDEFKATNQQIDDFLLGPFLEDLLNQFISNSKPSNIPLCADQKSKENTTTKKEPQLRTDSTPNSIPRPILVIVPSPSGEPTWTVDEVTGAVDEPNKEFRAAINKAYNTIAQKHSTGDLQDLNIFELSAPSMLVPLTMTSTKLIGSLNDDDVIPELVPYEELPSKLNWFEDYEDDKNPEPCITAVPLSNQIDGLNRPDQIPKLIPYEEPTRRNGDQDADTGVEKKKLQVVIPSPVGARTWTAGELMNAVSILDKSDKYKAAVKRAHDIVKQKIYNGELQNFRTIEVTMPASEISKWTSSELENALRSRRSMRSLEETTTDVQENLNTDELLTSSTIAPDESSSQTTDYESTASAELRQCN